MERFEVRAKLYAASDAMAQATGLLQGLSNVFLTEEYDGLRALTDATREKLQAALDGVVDVISES